MTLLEPIRYDVAVMVRPYPAGSTSFMIRYF